MALTKRKSRLRIKMRIRKRITGTAEAPRLSVFRSNKNFYAQIIDDISGKTLVSASSKSKDFTETNKIKKSEQAEKVGELIAQKAVQNGITEVKFDRNGYLYHGRVKSFAESARKAGLKF
jgi:large subunit ribosomal protein L18